MIKKIIRKLTSNDIHTEALIVRIAKRMKLEFILKPFYYFYNATNLRRNRSKLGRKLEIGPGPKRIDSFETINVIFGTDVDYVMDAKGKLPFGDDTFEVVYASHILEHIPWYQLEATLAEWVRVLKPGGTLEVWVPNCAKIMRALLKYEDEQVDTRVADDWYRLNPEKSIFKWANGRMLSYGDGSGDINNPNWHRTLFTPKFLMELFVTVGLNDVREMNSSEVRGYDHGWVNLGVVGRK